jgi:hypothetical protein
LEYTEFLKQPDIELKFNSMLNEQHEYYMNNRFNQDFDKEHRELMSIKLAFITTDMYFTSIHKKDNLTEG